MRHIHTIYPGVYMANAEIGQYVLIGVPPHGKSPGDLDTHIGEGALIRSHTVIYAGNWIGASFQTGHNVLVRELNQIGNNVSIGSHSVIEHHVQIGNNVRIHSSAFVPEFSQLDDDVWVGPGVVLTNARYPHSPSAKLNLKGPRLMSGAKIGANATLLPGITIGRNALIGAGAVVVDSVPEGKVVAGNPARIIRDVAELDAYTVERLFQREMAHG